MKILINPLRRWRTTDNGSVTAHHVGDPRPVGRLIESVRSTCGADSLELGEILRSTAGHFAAIIEGPDFVLAVVDSCRSIPLFYTEQPGALAVSNCARTLASMMELEELNPGALLEFSMAGYVTGGDTVLRGLRQLQAGELFVFDKRARRLKRERYYRYHPHDPHHRSLEQWVEALDEVLDRVFCRVVELAAGRPIWIPLSGGLDSRLIACKLKEMGHEPLITFSYGPWGNQEAQIAKHVARQLDLPWHYLPPRRRMIPKLINAADCRRYMAFGDGLSSIPAISQYDALKCLRSRGGIPADAVLINGQSGDYISGNHIPDVLVGPRVGMDAVADFIVGKHFGLWRQLLNPTTRAWLKQRILRRLEPATEADDGDAAPAAYESWEWQERQAKYVVNSVRLYEFLGCAWQLPLWDLELMRFFERVPLDLRIRRRLFREYLSRYDYRGLFGENLPRVFGWGWPGIMKLVIPLGSLVRRVCGARAEARVRRIASYYGHYGNLYAHYGLHHYLKNLDVARSITSFSVQTWLCQNGISRRLGFDPLSPASHDRWQELLTWS